MTAILNFVIPAVLGVFAILLWVFQLWMVSLIPRWLLSFWKRKTAGAKRWLLSVVSVIVFLALLVFLVMQPVVFCNGIDVPEDVLRSVRGQAGGLYSHILPLIPIYVYVERYSEIGGIYYTIGYFPFGTVGMSLGDGFHMEKPLTGW